MPSDSLPTTPPVLRSLGLSPLLRLVLIFVIGLTLSNNSISQETANLAESSDSTEPPAASHTYVLKIKPLLRTKCWACHGALAQQGGLRLDTVDAMRQGGDSGPALGLTPAAADTLIWQRITSTDSSIHMPQEGAPLDAEQLALLENWLLQGAPAPADETPEPDPTEHWAFRVPRRAQVPLAHSYLASAAGETSSVNNGELEVEKRTEMHGPIDAFVEAQLAERGLTSLPAADRATLLRRLSLDLTGLPPTIDELRHFQQHPAPDAYEREVDRLLASPAQGERWARHWMDIWRYADWHGRRMVPDVWNSAPQIWRWRDWIVDSSNNDLGYGPMVERMLAADEIAPTDHQASVATGYLIRNWYALNPNDWMRANVEHTARAFLGLSLQCAHCHDHKYDPITQVDYFAFRALFEPIGIRQDPVPGGEDPGVFQEYDYSVLRRVERRGKVTIFDRHADAVTYRYSGGDERNRDTERGPISPALPEFLSAAAPVISPVDLPIEAWYPGLHPDYQQALLDSLAQKIRHWESLAAKAQDNSAALQAAAEQRDVTEAEFAQWIMSARQASPGFALSGERSLWIDARNGRQILQRSLPELTEVTDGSTIEFRVKLFTDEHFNMQLAKDAVQGLTAGVVGFEKGRIFAYRPSSFEEFEIGHYDFAAGQNEFQVRWKLWPSRDVAEVSVTDRSGAILLAQGEVAINGWNPIGDPNRPLTFDTRNGQWVLLDDLRVAVVRQDQLVTQLEIGFEASDSQVIAEGADLVGMPNWSGSFLDQPGATAVVTSVPVDELFLQQTQKRLQAAARVKSLEIEPAAIEAELVIAKADQKRAVALIAAETARVKTVPSDEASTPASLVEVTAAALEAERRLQEQRVHSGVLTAEWEAAVSQALPLDDSTRATRIAESQKKLAAARTAMAVPVAAVSELPTLSRTYPQQSSGRRKALAEWITSPNNPLAARVAVNHVWARHLNQPLVETVDDFGRNGAAPSHPELLDWLAVDLQENGWSLKRLHRQIVCSAAYRRSSEGSASSATALQIDPAGKLLWRRPTGRMEAEVVRDSMLAIAERLDQQMGGQELENSEAFTSLRRSLYFSCHPEGDGRSEFGALFDAPDPLQCYRRTRTVMPQQALALTNSSLVHDLATRVAERLWQSAAGHDQSVNPQRQRFVALAFETVLSRAPNEAETEACLEFLAEGESEERTRAGLIRVLWNHHEFVTIR